MRSAGVCKVSVAVAVGSAEPCTRASLSSHSAAQPGSTYTRLLSTMAQRSQTKSLLNGYLATQDTVGWSSSNIKPSHFMPSPIFPYLGSGVRGHHGLGVTSHTELLCVEPHDPWEVPCTKGRMAPVRRREVTTSDHCGPSVSIS